MLEIEKDGHAVEAQKKSSPFRRFRRCLRASSFLPVRYLALDFSTFKPSRPSSPLGPKTPAPLSASFPSPAQVREHGKLVRICGYEERTVWRIVWEGVDMYVKGGKDVDEGEAKITELARVSTGLPIPRVYHVEKDGDETFIYLQSMPGENVGVVYWQLPPAKQRALCREIKRAVKRLHSVKAPPGSRVGGFGRKPLSAIFAELDVSPSLFSSSELNTFLRQSFIDKNPTQVHDYDQEIAPRLRDPFPLVLVHGDLWEDNILVENGRLSGIIDFERAGFLPEWVDLVAVARRMPDPPLSTSMLANALMGRRAGKRREWEGLAIGGYGWLGICSTGWWRTGGQEKRDEQQKSQ